MIYIIAGKGELDEYLENLILSLKLSSRVKLLGFRRDIGDLLEASDIFVMPSYREGLSVALMEAMSAGLPCVVSNIRGNSDLIDRNGGTLFNPNNINECKQAIELILKSNMKDMGKYNLGKIKDFSLEAVQNQMEVIIKKNS